MPRSVKDSNPKEGIGATRIPFHLLPDGPLALVAMAFYEGGLKYGPYNWRFAGVRASTYVAAVRRHISKWFNGHNTDPTSRVHHLANAIAGLMILLDAELQGKLNDDRPPRQDLEDLYGELEKTMAHLTELYGDVKPPNYTEVDYGPEARGEIEEATQQRDPSVTAREQLPVIDGVLGRAIREEAERNARNQRGPHPEPSKGQAAAGAGGCAECFRYNNA